jgi:hypothetical protein
MDEMEQAEAIWSGTHIGNHQDECHNILLYQIDSFYVEAYYNREHKELVRFRSFASSDQLSPYLEQIDIDKLIK